MYGGEIFLRININFSDIECLRIFNREHLNDEVFKQISRKDCKINQFPQ